MNRSSLLLIVFFFLLQEASAQPSQAEINRMMKQAQDVMKKYGKDSTVNKAMKDAQYQQKQVSDAMKNQKGNNNGNSNSLYSSDPGSYGNVDNWKFPPKNTALLASLPKKIFTKAELLSFLKDVYSQLSKKLPAGISSSVQTISAKYNNEGNKMGDVAVSGWYTNYREEGLLLIIKAAINSPDNGILLNNCAALLNMSGIEQTAIPILKYVLQSYPASSMVLNNLGQAYAGLGETDTAMVYLGRSIKIEPENNEANNTAGQIEATKGNKQKAAEYFEQSLKTAYCKPAELKLSRIKKDYKLVPLVKPRVKIPEYFNQFKYQFPAQCTSVENAAQADAENKAFREIIEIQDRDYLHKLVELTTKWAQLQQGKPSGRRVNKGEFMAQPFSEFCGIMARDLLADYSRELADMGPQGKVGKNYTTKLESLQNEYQSKYNVIQKGFDDREKEATRLNCCGEGNTSCCIKEDEKCKAYNGLANQYLPQFAAIMEDWQVKYQLIFKKYFDDLAYWSYLAFHNVPFTNDLASNPPPTDDFYRMSSFYPLVTAYLGMLHFMANTKIIKPCKFEPTTATKDSLAIKEMDCPLEIEIPFLVGKFEINCEKFSFKAGEGAVFGYEKNFKTKQSTVSVGIGVKLELEAKVGPVKAGVSTSAGETLFITFDGDNKFSDGGLKVDTKASAGVEGEAGKAVKGKKDLAKEETGVGVTFGINSGCNFNEGPFKGMIGPKPEVPLNKNVKIFKPG